MAAPTTVAPCWFNTKNKGETGLGHFRDPEPDFCSIRELAIEHSLYTYCSNHPYRRPDKDPIPIGPVFVATREGSRRIWRPSPDTEEAVCTFWSCRLKSGIPACRWVSGRSAERQDGGGNSANCGRNAALNSCDVLPVFPRTRRTMGDIAAAL